MSAGFCPGCGYDLVVDERVELGELIFDPRGDTIFHGQLVRLTLYERMILNTILKSGGSYVSREVLRERVGSRDGTNIIDVLLTRLRKKLRAVTGRNHILTMHAIGVRWAP